MHSSSDTVSSYSKSTHSTRQHCSSYCKSSMSLLEGHHCISHGRSGEMPIILTLRCTSQIPLNTLQNSRILPHISQHTVPQIRLLIRYSPSFYNLSKPRCTTITSTFPYQFSPFYSLLYFEEICVCVTFGGMAELEFVELDLSGFEL